MRTPILALAAALAATLGAAPAAPAAEGGAGLAVALRESARAAGPFVRLDEVAALTGGLAPRAGAVLLGRAPEAGRSRAIGRAEVRQRLIEEGFEAGSFDLTGAAETRIASAADPEPAKNPPAAPADPDRGAPPAGGTAREPAAAATTAPERLRALATERARAEMAAALGCPPTDVEIKLDFAAERDLPELSGEPEFELRWFSGRPRLGRQRLEMLLPPDDAEGRRTAGIALIAELAVMRDALVAARDLGGGVPFSAQDVRAGRVSTTDAAAIFVKDASELVGRAPLRGMRAGTPLEPRLLAKLILVRRGQPVTLLSESGPVRVIETVVARSDGGLGDRIIVERLNDRRQLAGRVAGSGLVKTE